MHRFPVPLAAVALLALAAFAASAGEPAAAATAVPRTVTAAPLTLLPAAAPALTPAEEQMISRSDAGLVPFYLPNGAVGLDLQGRFQEFATITVAPGGGLVFRCVDNADALRRILFGPAEPAPPVMEDR